MRRLVSAVGVRGLSLIATFALSTLVARVLGPNAAGVFFLIYTLLALFATVGRFGADNLALRSLGAGFTADTARDLTHLFRIVLVAGTLSTGLAFAVFTVSFASSAPVGVLLAAASCVLAQSVAVSCGTILRGSGQVALGVLAEIGSLPLVAVGIIFGWHALAPGGASLDLILIALSVAAWCTALWSFLLVFARWRRARSGGTEVNNTTRAYLREHFGALFPMMATSLLAYAIVWAPIFVLSVAGSLADVSYYSVAMRVANLVTLLPTIQISYLAPEFSKLLHHKDLTNLNRLAGRSTLFVLATTCVPVIGLAVFAPFVVTTVFGDMYLPAASLCAVLSVSALLVIACGQVNQLMLLSGLERTSLILTVACAVLWATAGFALAAYAGSSGVVWFGGALSVAYAATAALLLRARRGIRSYAAGWRTT